jgi:hypothetical protein
MIHSWIKSLPVYRELNHRSEHNAKTEGVEFGPPVFRIQFAEIIVDKQVDRPVTDHEFHPITYVVQIKISIIMVFLFIPILSPCVFCSAFNPVTKITTRTKPESAVIIIPVKNVLFPARFPEMEHGNQVNIEMGDR